MFHLGIDPGKSGGYAVLKSDGSVVAIGKMPVSDRELHEALKAIALTTPTALFATVERVNAGVFRFAGKMGVVSAFTFGGEYRRVLMALTALGVPFDLVVPVKWQNALSCRTRGDKNVSKIRAEQLFPKIKITHAIADALLIAEYGRRLHLGRLDRSASGVSHGKTEGKSEAGKKGRGQKAGA